MRELFGVAGRGMGLLAGVSLMALASPVEASLALSDFGLRDELFVQASGNTQVTNRIDTGLLAQAGPLAYQFTSTAAAGPIAGLAATATGRVSSDYGFLELSGSGTATPTLSPANGANARVIPNTSGDPSAYFRDAVQVVASGLAVGAPVSLTFSMNYTGQASFTGEGPAGQQSSANIGSLFRLTDLNRNDPDFTITHGPGSFDDSMTVTVAVGDILRIEGGLFGNGEAASGDALGPSSFSFDDPTTFNIDVITGGVSLLTGSGHDYATLTAPSGAPEPGAWALLGAGFLGLGAALRRRRRRREVAAA